MEDVKAPNISTVKSIWRNFVAKHTSTSTRAGTNTDHNVDSKLPKMRLEKVHTFHTNPFISCPSSITTDNASHSDSPQRQSQFKKDKMCQNNNEQSHTTTAHPLTQYSLAAWAPNVNHSKNVELLAIASPLNIGTSSSAVGCNSTANNQSNLFILVFDETTFSHSMEFTVVSEIGELFGLPPQRMHNRRKDSSDCGIRRPIFFNSSSVKCEDEVNGQNNDIHSSSTTIQNHSLNAYISGVKPFLGHLKDEIMNCARLVRYELLDDGRLVGLSAGIHKDVYMKEKQTPSDSRSLDSYSESNSKYHDTSDQENKPQCPIKPQLVFHIRLPYSSASMEVTQLEWNADGTILSIIQKRKGVTNPFAIASNANLTNKKKKSSALPLSPTVSFWTVPEWLNSEETMKMTTDDDEWKYDTDTSLNNGNNTAELCCGWDIDDDNKNKSTFPLWEWYLAKYVFKDELSMHIHKKSKISLQNCVKLNSFPMELNPHSLASSAARRKNSAESSSSIINGDVTCLIWEDSPIIENYDDKRSNTDTWSNGKQKDSKNKVDNVAAKWVAVCTSKGQVVLHNAATSHLSYECDRLSIRKIGGDSATKNTITNLLTNLPPQVRSVTVPSRHKKRIMCGIWVDNMLIFGNYGSGSLSIFSTSKKAHDPHVNFDILSNKNKERFVLDERTVKMLGTITLPGGRDADQISLCHIEDTSTFSILSVNCEGKTLLFYYFLQDPGMLASSITNAQAIEVSFSMQTSMVGSSQKSFSKFCGTILFYSLIPNTSTVIVSLSNGYLALIDWYRGLILCDVDLALRSWKIDVNDESFFNDRNDYLIDCSFHSSTNTIACLTQSSQILVYHIQLDDGTYLSEAKDLSVETGLQLATKVHKPPKSSASQKHTVDLECKKLSGLMKFICSHSVKNIPTLQPDYKKGQTLLSFSSDGECVSVSLGDESVQIFSVIVDDNEAEQIKHLLAECIYQGRDTMYMIIVACICAVIFITFGGTNARFLSSKLEYFSEKHRNLFAS